MNKIVVPEQFNGEKFAKKFNLDPDTDFVLRPGRVLDCPPLPDLTPEDLSDCVGLSEKKPTLDEFIDAYSEGEKGNNQKMKDLLDRHERTKDK